MIHGRIEDLYKAKFVSLWMLLSLKAGYLNAAGFLATGNFVSHITGFGTSMGVSIAHEDYFFGIELLILPIAFILGSSVPAWLLDWKYSESEAPKYHRVQFLITMGIALIFLLGVNQTFGDFSTIGNDQHDVILIGILCFVCGMKNGLSTWATVGRIRTTHLTGLATDIGLNLPKIFRRQEGSRFPEPKKVNLVRVLTFLSFSFGSLVAALVFPKLGYWGLIFPFIISAVLSFFSYASYLKQGHSEEAAKNKIDNPKDAVKELLDGNLRFIHNKKINRNYSKEIAETKDFQKPFAVVVSCMDSRTSSEIIFDQGLGAIFSIRIAGNVVTPEVIASCEYACHAAGASLIVVLGHTGCGAIKGAIDNANFGQLHTIVDRIRENVDKNISFAALDARQIYTDENVKAGVKDLHRNSSILSNLQELGKLKIIGGIYDITSGEVALKW